MGIWYHINYFGSIFKNNIPILGVPLALIGIAISVWVAWCMWWVGIIIIIFSVAILVMELSHIYKRELPPHEIAINGAKTVWGLWFTGNNHFNLIRDNSPIKRILLIAPDSKAFIENKKISGGDAEDIKKEIKGLTKKAKDKGIDVHWYNEPRTLSFTIYDKVESKMPDSLDAYLIYSKLKDDSAPSVRETRKIKHSKGSKGDKEYFEARLKEFDNIWEDTAQSKKPEPKDYEDGK